MNVNGRGRLASNTAPVWRRRLGKVLTVNPRKLRWLEPLFLLLLFAALLGLLLLVLP